MKTFEEKWTAWIDDQLTGEELTEFEISLPDRAAAEAEKRDALKLRTFLKQQLAVAPAMGNEEFFHHQLRQAIARERASQAVGSSRAAQRVSWWNIGRLAWAGAGSLAIFAICTFFVIRSETKPEQSQYLTQILNARVDPAVSPNATITAFESKEDKATVLWVEGLQSLPSDYAAK
jgi:hypothetical protein